MMIGHKLLGQGAQKVLVLHGWLGDSSVFDPVLPFLDLRNFTYAFMDYRGYGLSTNLPGEHTIAEIGQDALELADSLGWEQFSLIGHSMGGMAIQWIAAQAPERILRMTGIVPVPASGFQFDAATEALFRGAKDNPENRHAILMHTTGGRLTPMFGRVMTERSVVQTTPDAFDDYLTAWSQTVFFEQVACLNTPFQILVGAHDPAVTVELMQSTLLQWFPNAELTVIENAGHYPMIEAPVALITLWESFLMQKSLAGSIS
jgi:pimeloyl-ACP methyl ester carboxylesterase